MKKRTVLLFGTVLLSIALLVSCAPASTTTPKTGTTTAAPATTVPTVSPLTTKPSTDWRDQFGKPRYGGTLTWRVRTDPVSWDPYYGTDTVGFTFLYRDFGTKNGWGVDPKEAPYAGGFTPFDAREYQLVESWEIVGNYETFIFRLRKGIRWQNKPPMNGREFTAYDVEYGWHRMAGLGSGFSKGSPYVQWKGWDDIQYVKAVDKYTIEFKLKYSVPGLFMLTQMVYWEYPKEVQEQYGGLQDWRNQVGTGPFILKDYVPGSSATYSRNPDYWGYDERHPENKLPYLDAVKLLVIPDQSTAEAALRTGKIAVMPGVLWDASEAFAKSNPEILQAVQPRQGFAVTMRIDKPPFTDIKVRRALNMSIDRKKIAETYYGGRIGGKPYSAYGPTSGPYYTPFEEWPEELKKGNTYDPAGARKLLVEAGYPNGFKSNMVVSAADDLDLPQVILKYFADVGVATELKIVEAAAFRNFVNVSKGHDQMVWSQVGPAPSGGYLPRFTSKMPVDNICMINDKVLDELIDREALYPFDSKEKISYNKQADMYAMALYLQANILPETAYTIYQPWLKGYSGQSVTSITTGNAGYFARWWLDLDLMKSKGLR